ncbi:MAG: replicative DNA helicase [Planctomycetes bacterium]|nr:replicative DNA helicase [Planctomycetota bacterium]
MAQQGTQGTARPQKPEQARKLDPVAAGRVPPQDLDAEMSLLGCMLIDRDFEYTATVMQVIPRDESHRFYRPDHRLLYEVVIDLYDARKPMDIVVMEDELRRRSQLEEIGGRDYLIELVQSVASLAHIEHYAKIVRDKSMLRDLIQCSHEIMVEAYDESSPAGEILDAAEKKLFDITEQRISNQPESIQVCTAQLLEHMEKVRDGLSLGVPSGFLTLDEMLGGGFQHGDLVVIAARPSIGKTAVALSMLEWIGVIEKRPAAFFSMEMSKLQVAQRMLCSLCYVDMQKLRRGLLDERDLRKLEMGRQNIEHAPVYIDDTPGMSIMELRAKARRLSHLHGIEIIFVDYLQLMHDPSSRESRQQEIAAISRGLKALGRELKVPIIALAQLNRQVEGRSQNRPRMSDLRESGAIEQDADAVILLHREEYYLSKMGNQQSDGEDADSRNNYQDRLSQSQGKAELIIDKQRNGPTGIVELHFTAQFARFDNAAPKYIGDDASMMDHGDIDPGEPPIPPPQSRSAPTYTPKPPAAAHDYLDDSDPAPF